MFIVLFFSTILFPQISIAIRQNASADESVWHNAMRAHRRNSAAVTMGRYSERDGDRDMLERGAGLSLAGTSADHFANRPSSQTISGRWMVGQTVQQQRQQQQRLNDPGKSAELLPMISQQQQAHLTAPPPSHTLSRPIRPAQSLPAGPGNALSRYDTHLSRFASSAPSGAISSQMVLPSAFVERIRNGVPPSMQSLAKQQSQQYAHQTNGAERPRTLILTNERIAKLPEIPSEQMTANSKLTAEQRTSPLSEFRHEDIRPAVDGERAGQQAKYAGQTNEYREDLGKQFMRKDERSGGGTAEYHGASKYNGEDGPAIRMAGMGINAPPEGTRIRMDARELSEGNMGREGLWHGRVSAYVNAPEEITGSRVRNIDEHLNALNGGNRGRGQNRYVKMDLLNE